MLARFAAKSEAGGEIWCDARISSIRTEHARVNLILFAGLRDDAANRVRFDFGEELVFAAFQHFHCPRHAVRVDDFVQPGE